MKSKRRKLLIVFLWLLVLTTAAVIFFFSSQDAEASTQTSNGFVFFWARLVIPGFDGMTIREQRAILKQAQGIIRKAAHFSEFAMLGASLRLLFHALRLRWPVLCAWTVGTLYACTDELHQIFVSGRAGMWQDVCIDSAGVLAAVLLTTLWLWLRRRRRRRA